MKVNYEIFRSFLHHETMIPSFKLYNDSSLVFKPKHKAKHGKGLKILTLKQMLTIVFAQLKTGNISTI